MMRDAAAGRVAVAETPPGDAPPPRRPPFVLLIAMTGLGPVSANMFVPSIPTVQKALETTYATAQLTLTLYMACFAVALLVYGPLSDRYGRRPVLLVSLGVYILGSLACLMAPAIDQLIAGRVLQAAGGCAGFSLCRAMVRDIYEDRAAKMIAYLGMSMAVGPMVSPAIGGYLDVWYGWHAPFVAMTGIGSVLFVAAIVALHETRPGTPKAGMMADLIASFSKLLRMRRYLGYALQIAFTTSVFFAFVGAMPLVMVEHFGRPTSDYGLYFMALPTMFMTGSFIAGRSAGKVANDTMIRRGSAVVLTGAGLIALVISNGWEQPLTLFLLTGMITLGSGITQAYALAGAVGVDSRIAGAAAGLAGSLQTSVNACASFVVGLVVTGSPFPMMVVMVTAAIMGVVCHTIGTWPIRKAG